jgi:hypothetical protein
MQTFLPYKDFRQSLSSLDNRRLGNQRRETRVILNTLLGVSNGWKNHPAVKMWRGYENALTEYFNINLDLWMKLGFKNTYDYGTFFEDKTFDDPPWLGDENFHASHRSNLLRKNPEYYSQFGWIESSDLPYIWPLAEEKNA